MLQKKGKAGLLKGGVHGSASESVRNPERITPRFNR